MDDEEDGMSAFSKNKMIMLLESVLVKINAHKLQ